MSHWKHRAALGEGQALSQARTLSPCCGPGVFGGSHTVCGGFGALGRVSEDAPNKNFGMNSFQGTPGVWEAEEGCCDLDLHLCASRTPLQLSCTPEFLKTPPSMLLQLFPLPDLPPPQRILQAAAPGLFPFLPDWGWSCWMGTELGRLGMEIRAELLSSREEQPLKMQPCLSLQGFLRANCPIKKCLNQFYNLGNYNL